MTEGNARTEEEEASLIIVGNRKHSNHIFRALLEDDWSIAAAVTVPADTTTQVDYQTMQDTADEFDIPLLEVADINSDSVYSSLGATDPDLGLCCGWTDIIGERVLQLPRFGFLGLHASPLPKGRGGAPVNWQLIRGHDQLGVSLFRLVPEVDHGDVVDQRFLPIEHRDDIATVYPRFTQASVEMVLESLPEIVRGTATWNSQSWAEATYWPARKPQDGIVDWSRNTKALWNWTRALTKPYPGAFTFYEGHKVIVWRSEPTDRTAPNYEPGDVVNVVTGQGIDVKTGDGVLRVTRVQIPGRPSRWADDFAIDHGLDEGDSFGDPNDFPDWLYTGLRDQKGGFEYPTTVSQGETVTFQAVCCSYARQREIGIEGRLAGTTIVEETVTADGWEAVDIPATVTESGSHTLKVDFEETGEQYDSRFIKVYCGTDTGS